MTMLTQASAPVDRHGGDGLWLSVSQLAAERGVSKQAVSKNIKRWAANGTPVTARRSGRSLIVNVAEYDRLKGEVGDQAHELAVETKKAEARSTDPTYGREQARRAAYEADLKRLDLEERLGKLVPVEALEQASIACAESLVRVFDQVVTRAEEVAAAVAKDGITGARATLRMIIRDLRARAAEEFAKLPALSMAPTTSPNETDA